MIYVHKDNKKWRDRIPKIKYLLEKGYSIQNIADKYSVSRQCVWNICHLYGLNTSNILSKKFRRIKNIRVKRRKQRLYNRYGIYSLPKFDTKKQKTDFDTYRKIRNVLNHRGAKFNLAFNDLVFPAHCPILGIKLSYFNKGMRKDNSVSIDRIDNKLGYVKNNIIIISWRANRLKSDGTADEHAKIAKFVKSKLRRK